MSPFRGTQQLPEVPLPPVDFVVPAALIKIASICIFFNKEQGRPSSRSLPWAVIWHNFLIDRSLQIRTTSKPKHSQIWRPRRSLFVSHHGVEVLFYNLTDASSRCNKLKGYNIIWHVLSLIWVRSVFWQASWNQISGLGMDEGIIWKRPK